jgi:hypothetical protein
MINPDLSVRSRIVFTSRFMPCTDCGESVERSAAPGHRCSKERLVEYQMFGLREDIASFEDRLGRFLQSGVGRFEVWLAARQVQE